MSNPWFRMYAEFITDPVMQCLSFEDQRHYAGILCMKCSGLLDRNLSETKREQIIIKTLGLDQTSGQDVKRKLKDMDLINSHWEPKAWNKRQFLTPESAKK